MPIKLADFARKTKALEIDYQGDKLNVVYRPGDITPKHIDAITALQTGDRAQVEQWAELLAMMESWDLLGDDGKPVPFTAEALAPVPLPFLAAVFQAVLEDAMPNPQRRESSSGSFSRRGH